MSVCPPEHGHGAVSTCYVQHRCRCDECRAAHALRERRRSRLKAYGRWDSGLVDAGPVREHLRYLSANGMGYKRVAELAGVSVTGTRSMIYGRQDPGPRYGEMPARCAREKAEAILAVRVDFESLAGGARVSSRGTVRRLQALVTIGWSQSKLAHRLGIRPENMTAVLRRPRVTVRFHREVAALYEELWNTLPPREGHRDLTAYRRALHHAERHGWVPPMAWDDIDQDPAPAVPEPVDEADHAAVELAVTGVVVKLTPRDREEAVRRLHGQGFGDGQIARVLRCTDRTVLRIRGRLGLEANVEGAA